MKILFWTLLFSIIYCYFIYPLLIGIFSRMFKRNVEKKYEQPTVTIVMSVYNEEDVIETKLKNLLSLDYPCEKITVLIGSDGSDDRTTDVIHNCRDQRIHLHEYSQRRGKMEVLNELVHLAKSDVIVFTDARQTFQESAVKELVANFNDPKVGCVSGELILSEKEGATARGVNLYWRYEKSIRKHESDLHSMIGATGAIYAIRRNLFTKIPTSMVLDDVFVPLKIVEQGYRSIFDDSAKAFDEVADSPREEHRRKSRTLYGNYQIFNTFAHLFNPLTSPIAIQLFSHKLLRVLIPFFMIFLIFLNWILIYDPFYKILFILQITFYAMALCGALARHSKYGILKTVARLCYVPYVFCLLNLSALVGFFKFIFSKQAVTWEKARA